MKWYYIKNDNTMDKDKPLGYFINEGFNKREVEPTPNNPNSSRSYM
jgi:hypothetical protein